MCCGAPAAEKSVGNLEKECGLVLDGRLNGSDLVRVNFRVARQNEAAHAADATRVGG